MSAIAALPTPLNGAQIAARLAGATLALRDNKVTIVGNADATKVLAFTLAGNTTGKTLTLAPQQTTNQQLNFPNITATDTLSSLGMAQTFTKPQTISLASGGPALTIIGTAASFGNSPDIRLNYATDADAAFSFFAYNHNNIALVFDAYFNGANWIASDTTAYHIYKTGGKLQFYANSGLTKGSSFTPTAVSLTLAPNSTAASSSTTGTAIIGDGSTASSNVGIGGGNIFAGGTTDSSSTTTGALQCAGGGAFAKSLTIGGSAGNFLNIANSTGALKINGTQVIGPRITGYGTPTGGVNQGSFAAGAITLPNLAASVAQLILDLKAHGVLGT